jgi:hypothetical protein
VGILLKIVFASTTEQEEKITKLVNQFYSTILPKYFSDKEISSFIDMNFLNVQGTAELSGTLKESYQIISSLETLIFLIESNGLYKKQYQEMFDKNTEILQDLGLSFPFSYKQFTEEKDIAFESGSIYIKAANEWIL